MKRERYAAKVVTANKAFERAGAILYGNLDAILGPFFFSL